jgi:glycosyltransferase involved in cell wall biosynthesis
MSNFSKANQLLRQNKFKEAVAEYRESIKRNETFFAYENMGMIFEKLNQPNEAEKAYKAALKINPSAVRAKLFFEKNAISAEQVGNTDPSPSVKDGRSQPNHENCKERLPLPSKPVSKLSEQNRTRLADTHTQNKLSKTKDNADSFPVLRLGSLLWTGFRDRAEKELSMIAHSPVFPREWRSQAFEYLADIAFYHEQNEASLNYIQKSNDLDNFPSIKRAITEIRLLLKLMHLDEAKSSLANAREDFPNGNDWNWAILESSLERQAAISAGKSLRDIYSAQLAPINRTLIKYQLAPISLKNPDKTAAFENLTALTVDSIDDGPLVSVLVPAFNAAQEIHVAIHSLLNQTYRNIEILVANDASTDNTSQVVADISTTDPRVKLISLETNRGAYTARNTALSCAKGEWVMTHDTDDWSHPQKIEYLVKTVLEDEKAYAVMAHWFRVDPNIDLVGPWRPKNKLFDEDFSSLLFRRSIVNHIGKWDSVRVGADTAFRDRILAKYGRYAVKKIPLPLSLSLTRSDSLTRSKETHISTLRHGLRWTYRQVYTNHLSRANSFRRAQDFLTPSILVPISNQQDYKASCEIRADIFVYAQCFESFPFLDNLISILKVFKEKNQKVLLCPAHAFSSYPDESISKKITDFCMNHDIAFATSSNNVSAPRIFIGSRDILDPLSEFAPKVSCKEAFILSFGGPLERTDAAIRVASDWLGIVPSSIAPSEIIC